MSDDTKPQDDQDNSGEKEQQPPPEPDTSVEAPDFDWVTEADASEPERRKRGPNLNPDVIKADDIPD